MLLSWVVGWVFGFGGFGSQAAASAAARQMLRA
jgi:hypothetical protein